MIDADLDRWEARPQGPGSSGGCLGSRAVVLGASNIALGLPAVVAAAESCLVGPVEVVCAGGHGRSYGADSRALFRGLPGILESGVWRHLSRANEKTKRNDPESAPMQIVVITDIGNDLIYGRSPQKLLGWIDQVLERCADAARVVLVMPPMKRLRELTPFSVALATRVFFPRRSMDPDFLIDACLELSEGLWRLAEQRPVVTVVPERAWYGIDPLHIRRSERQAAWCSIFKAAILTDGKSERVGKAPSPSFSLLRPEVWTLGGRNFGKKQPCAIKSDGAGLWLY